jgi:enamine deaminase RidA (YjgF/YER057c/UK114 family)
MTADAAGAATEVDRAQRPPPSTLVQVAGLFRPDILIEVEAVAAVPAS